MHTPDFAPEKSTTVRSLPRRSTSASGIRTNPNRAVPGQNGRAPNSHWIVQHCPRLATLVLAELFVAPRQRVKRYEPPVGAKSELMHAGRQQVRVHLVGEGPLVVLLHDWQGGASQLGRLAQGLANAGLCAALFDMPAHGESPGLTSDLSEFIDVTAEVCAQLGSVQGLIGHGLGGLAGMLCAARGLPLSSTVAIAPVPSFEFAVQQFSQTYALEGDTQELLLRRIERRIGLSRRDASLAGITPATPTLVVHDVLDRSVPVRSSRQVTAAWRGARLMETCGLGHQRILNSPPVIHFIANFLRGFPPPQSC
jgi:pimeloyl-ACP methyl ester carboxylesterase